MKRPLAQIQALIRELRRRQVIRVAVVYATTAFVILQLGEILVEPFGLGDWALRFVLFLLVLGFPLALGLAWVYNLTEEGVVREVREETAGEEAASQGAPLTSNRLIVGLLIVAIGLLLYPRMFSSGEGTADQGAPAAPDTAQIEERSIAVLPFANLSGTEKARPLVRGLHDDLLTRLSNVSDLKVISRTSVEKYRDTELSLPAIADSLGVRWIVEGGVQRSKNKIQVNAQLIDPRSDVHRWAGSYQRDLSAEGLFAIQGEIAGEIADALEAKLTPEEQRRIAGSPTEELGAYRLYVQGRQALDRATSREDHIRAAAYFGRALQKDSTYALAWAGLADSEVTEAPDSLLPDSLHFPDVSQGEAARRALKLNPDLAEAHAALGHFYLEQRNAPAALRELRKAVDLKPSYAQAHALLGTVLQIIGRLEEGVRHFELAEELNPQHVRARHRLYDAYNRVGKHKKALKLVRRQRRLVPGREEDIWAEIRTLSNLGRSKEAITLAKKRLKEAEDLRERLVLHNHLALAEARAGDTLQARKHLKQMHEISLSPQQRQWAAWLFASAYAATGDFDAAFDEYRRQEDWPPVPTIGLRQEDHSLRGDPRFDELIREVNRAWGLNPDGTIPEKSPSSTSPNTDA